MPHAEAAAAPEAQPLLERPGVRPAGLRQFLRDLGTPYVSNGVIGLIFAGSGPIAVTLAVGTAGGLTDGQLASWVFAILFSGGAATVFMSLLYRQPLGFAWSIPGTVLLGPSLQHLSFPEVVGAFFTSGYSRPRPGCHRDCAPDHGGGPVAHCHGHGGCCVLEIRHGHSRLNPGEPSGGCPYGGRVPGPHSRAHPGQVSSAGARHPCGWLSCCGGKWPICPPGRADRF